VGKGVQQERSAVSVRHVGLDIGYGFVKVTDMEYGYAFPSVIGIGQNRSTYRIPTELERINDLKVILDDQFYFVGKAALRHSRFAARDLSALRHQNQYLKVLFLAGLSFYCQGEKNEFRVVTGLPTGSLHWAADLTAQLIQEFSFSICRHRLCQDTIINIRDLEVVPQPMGTYWAQILNVQGQEKQSVDRRVGIIDIGFRTTDLAAIEEGEFIPQNSFTIPVGMADSYSEIAQEIGAKYGLNRESYALDENVIQGTITVAGKPVDITHLRDRAFTHLANKLLLELNSNWQVADFDRLFFSGGGSLALGEPYLLPHFPQAELVSNPSTANSRGYLSWANRLWGNFS
jgi:plasmid segregation protein ParM